MFFMRKSLFFLVFLVFFASCQKKTDKIENLSEKQEIVQSETNQNSLLDTDKRLQLLSEIRTEIAKARGDKAFGLSESGMSAADIGGNEFCWKDSKTRGVGVVPNSCEDGYEQIGLLCYSKCDSSKEKRFGFDCHSVCPSGFTDNGLICRSNAKTSYGRGAGYALWSKQQCINENSLGCEQYGLMYYPKCKTGFSASGCCICQSTATCSTYGMGGIFPDCTKNLRIGEALPGVCGGDTPDEDSGLCYTACDSGYDGVGPVCWMVEPPFDSWVECGAGYAKDDETCALVIYDQTISVMTAVLSLVTLGLGGYGAKGISTALENVATAATSISQAAQIADTASSIAEQGTLLVSAASELSSLLKDANEYEGMTLPEGIVTTADMVLAATGLTSGAGELAKMNFDDGVSPEEAGSMIGVGLDIAAFADPTGLVGTALAFTYSVCSDLDGAYGKEAEDYFTACSSNNTCFDIENGSYEGNQAKLGSNRETSKESYDSAFRINPISEGSEYVTICVAGVDSLTDTDLCLHAVGGVATDNLIQLHNGVEYNKAKPNGSWKITPVSSSPGYVTICASGKESIGDGKADLCMHAVSGDKLKLKYTQSSNEGRTNGKFKIEHTDPIFYGESINLESKFDSATRTYLDTRGAGCESNEYCVSASAEYNRESGSGTWEIVSSEGKTSADCLSYGDKIHLKNKFSTETYLDTRNSNCDGNKICVSTSKKSDRDAGSGKWEVLTPDDEEKTGCVAPHDLIHLRNQYRDKYYLDVRGESCESNKYCVSGASSKTREGNSGVWRIKRSYY